MNNSKAPEKTEEATAPPNTQQSQAKQPSQVPATPESKANKANLGKAIDNSLNVAQ